MSATLVTIVDWHPTRTTPCTRRRWSSSSGTRVIPISGDPRSPAAATCGGRHLAGLLAVPHVTSPAEAEGFWDLFRAMAGDQLRGNEVPDAHIAALMRQHGVRVIYTRDRGLRRFEGIEPVDPVA